MPYYFYKMLFLFSFISLLFCLTACKKEENIKPSSIGTLFSYQSLENSLGNEKKYIILSDPEGKVLAVNLYKAKEKLTIPRYSTFQGNKIHVTFFTFYAQNQQLLFQTYTNIDTAQSWFIKANQSISNQDSLTISLSNFSSIAYENLLVVSNFMQKEFTFNQIKTKSTVSIKIKGKTSDIYIKINYKNKIGDYVYFKQAQSFQKLGLDFASRRPLLQKTIQLSDKNYLRSQVLLTGILNQGSQTDYYTINSLNDPEFSAPIKGQHTVYIPNELVVYDASLYWKKTNTENEFCSLVGFLPDAFPVMKVSAKSVNKSAEAFYLQTEGFYDYLRLLWFDKKQANLSWEVYHQAQSDIRFTFPSLPDSLKQQYSALKNSNLYHKETYFWDSDVIKGYEDYINILFKELVLPNPQKAQSKQIMME